MITYPSFYPQFRCIAGDCPDTCCRGWDVELDEETYYSYLVAKGPVGERLRGSMAEEDGCFFFPLTDRGRCPFLNARDLCDIYTELGPERLCRTCREYPRSFAGAGRYEQADLSLSCPEAGRLFFDPATDVSFVTDPDGGTGEFAGRSPADETSLNALLAERDRLLAEPFGEADAARLAEDLQANLPELRTEMQAFRLLDERWMAVRAETDAWQSRRRGSVAADAAAFFAETPEALLWFARLRDYFLFRYAIDGFYEEDRDRDPLRSAKRLTSHSLQILLLMCLTRREHRVSAGEPFARSDMEELARLYSREAEHADENLQILKKTVSP
ncbi:MAG: flagellin lysine-N-methylase [Clostridia bacterium]|nr:flagellin lysine-N-methylase [Clostridia bacterium]